MMASGLEMMEVYFPILLKMFQNGGYILKKKDTKGSRV